jgi:hypothetical protein
MTKMKLDHKVQGIFKSYSVLCWPEKLVHKFWVIDLGIGWR